MENKLSLTLKNAAGTVIADAHEGRKVWPVWLFAGFVAGFTAWLTVGAIVRLPVERATAGIDHLYNAINIVNVAVVCFFGPVTIGLSAICVFYGTWWCRSGGLNRSARSRQVSQPVDSLTTAAQSTTAKAALVAVPLSIVLIGAVGYGLLYIF